MGIENSEHREEKPETLRMFVAIPLPRDVIREIEQFQSAMKAVAGRSVRWTPTGQFHITLQFWAAIPASELNGLIKEIGNLASAARPAHLLLAGGGCFPSIARPHVIWAGVHDDTKILSELERQLSCDDENRKPFHAHITLGRIRDRLSRAAHGGLRESIQQPLSSIEWTAGEIHLVRSTLRSGGAVHETIATFPLGG